MKDRIDAAKSPVSGSRAYTVTDAATGATIKNCFVLRPETDDAAISAIRAYERATIDKPLAERLEEWVCGIIRRKYAGERREGNGN